MPNATNERLRQILGSSTDLKELFVIRALEHLLEEIDPGSEDEILDDMLPAAPNTQAVLFGHAIGVYSGMNRATLKAKFDRDANGNPLTDADVDAIFAALGVTTGTSLMGGPAEGGEEEMADEHPPLIEAISGKDLVEPAPKQKLVENKGIAAKEEKEEKGTKKSGSKKEDDGK